MVLGAVKYWWFGLVPGSAHQAKAPVFDSPGIRSYKPILCDSALSDNNNNKRWHFWIAHISPHLSCDISWDNFSIAPPLPWSCQLYVSRENVFSNAKPLNRNNNLREKSFTHKPRGWCWDWTLIIVGLNKVVLLLLKPLLMIHLSLREKYFIFVC